MQTVSAVFGSKVRELQLPSPQDEVMQNVRWGHFLDFFTPAYWAAMMWMAEESPNAVQYKFGRTLKEEVAICLLGGHGITGEMSFAAFKALRQEGALARTGISRDEIHSVLQKPLLIGGKSMRYRFPGQKSSFLAPVLNQLDHELPPAVDHRAFRDWFLQFRGIGLKTASWITRNWLNSGRVAILDIHLIRCGILCGLFKSSHSPQRDYLEMESLYLEFAKRIKADPAKLDVFMWQQMRTASRIGMRAINGR